MKVGFFIACKYKCTPPVDKAEGVTIAICGESMRGPIGRIGRVSIWLLLCGIAIGGCMPAKRVSTERSERTEVAETIDQVREAQSEEAASPKQRSLLMACEPWVGVPYRYGGTDESGVDCSAFVRSVFSKVEVNLPRTSRMQSESGHAVGRASLEVGDLLFFNTSGSGVSHVGIYIGDSRFIHASTSRGVIVSSMNERYYAERFLFARRIL